MKPPPRLTCGVLTCSDRCAQGAEDLSGPALAVRAAALGFEVSEQAILPDDKLKIVKLLVHWCDERSLSLVLTTGGTGATARDVTPEATRMVIERPFPGLAEAMRAESLRHTPAGLLSRGEAGSRGQTLLLNFPGSPKAVEELWPVVSGALVHACRLLAGEHDPHP